MPSCKVDVVRTSAEHIDDIMVVENLSFTVPWSREAFIEEVTRNRLAVYLSAVVDNRVVGYAGMWRVCDEGHITNIAVHPDFRKNGVGSTLLEGLIKEAKKLNITRLTLEVRKSNLEAQNLYRKFGFKAVGIRKSYYTDNGEDAIIMWKYRID